MDKQKTDDLQVMWDGSPWYSHEEQIPLAMPEVNLPLTETEADTETETDPKHCTCEEELTLYVELI